jgi:site-specific DNA recombinase
MCICGKRAEKTGGCIVSPRLYTLIPRQLLSTKSRLENQMDTLDVSDPHYERKILDLQRRYDDQYDKIAEAEQQIEDIRKRIQTIRSEQISGENVYQLLLAFDELYGEMDESGKKELLRAIIERIDLFPEKREDGCGSGISCFPSRFRSRGMRSRNCPWKSQRLLRRYAFWVKKI